MKFRQFITLDDFLNNIHKDGYGLIEYEENNIPCLYVQQSLYDIIIKKSLGKKYVIDVLLNIFYDGRYVFVDIQLEFINLDIEENFLLHANTSMDFFNSLSESGMLAIMPKNPLDSHNANIFMVQLPNKEKISKAVDIIKSNLGIKNINEKETA